MRTGTTILHYEIGELLGRGGMGDVYRALDTRLDRPVALKFLAGRYVADEEAKQRFVREAKAVSALDHPNICTVHDIGETEDGGLYIVMALYEGKTLKARLVDETFDAERSVGIVRQVAEALKRAHAGGIIHRDVKPANTMVSDEDAVRLLDFGLAKLQTGDSLTQTGMTLGTAAYMSPEQAVGDPVTPASDVWSLGVMAYEMLAGTVPFKGERPLAMVHAIVNSEPPSLAEVRPEVPGPVAEVIHRAMAKRIEDRFADAAEFLAALDDAVGGRAAAGSGPGSSYGSAGLPGPARTRPRGAVGAVLAVAAVAVLAVAFWPDGAPPPSAGEGSRDVLAVLPFTISGSSELAYLSEGLMDLVSGRLDGAGPLRTVDPRAVVGAAGQDPAQTLDPEQGAAVARSLGAGRFISGRVVGLGDRVSLSARLHLTDSASVAGPVVTVEGSADSLFALVDELATGLLGNMVTGANARIQRAATESSGSIQATKEFLRGEQFHRRGQFDSASAAYNRALAYDSTFALAHLMKSMNNSYTYDTDDYVAALDAVRYSEGLPERDRALILAFRDQQGGRLEEAEQAYISHLTRYPDEVKALWQLARLYHRGNPTWGRSMDEARPLYERVLAIEPENVPALHNLARLDAAARRYDLLPARAEAIRRVAPNTEWAVDVETMAAFALQDSAAVQRLTEDFAQQSLLVRLYSVYNALRFAPDPLESERLLGLMGAGAVNEDTGLPEGVAIDADIALSLRMIVSLVLGRYDEIRTFLGASDRQRTATWDVWDAELVATDLFRVDSTLVAQVLERLERVTAEERLRSKFEPIHDIFTPAVVTLERDVNIAKLMGRLGRFEEAWAIQRDIGARPPYEAWESLREDAARGLAADLHFLAGDRERALEVLRTQRFQVPSTAASLALTAGSHARFLRAELELELGDPEVARRFYEGLVGSFTPSDKLFLAPSVLRLGQIHDAAGRTEDAVFYYEKFVRMWSQADAELAPRRDDAAARLAELRGGS